MRITKLLFVQTGTYNQMVLRPYYTNVDPITLEAFQEATEGGNNLKPSALAGVAGSVIKPKAQAEGVVGIPNGWNEARLRFLMEIQHDEYLGARNTQILTGYTDYVGATVNGNIDYNMRLYFNNSIMLRNVVIDSPFGRVNQSTVADASQILLGAHNTPPQGGFSSVYQNGVFCMRPEDVFNTMEANMLSGDVYDIRSIASNRHIKKSRRSNNVAPTYLSRIMRSFRSAVAESDTTDGLSDFIQNARGEVKEALPAQDLFLQRVSRMSQLNENGCLTFGELVELDPNLPRNTLVNLIDSVRRSEFHYAGSTEHWQGSGMETVAATILSHAVPSLVLDLLMTRVTFMATNDTIGGHYETRILEVKGFTENIDLTPYVEMFIRRLEIEVLRDITHNNNVSVSLTMTADVLGDTHISISMNGQPAIDFVAPSFCDALLAPVLTLDQTTLRTVANDLEVLATEVAQPTRISNVGGNDGYNSLV